MGRTEKAIWASGAALVVIVGAILVGASVAGQQRADELSAALNWCTEHEIVGTDYWYDDARRACESEEDRVLAEYRRVHG